MSLTMLSDLKFNKINTKYLRVLSADKSQTGKIVNTLLLNNGYFLAMFFYIEWTNGKTSVAAFPNECINLEVVTKTIEEKRLADLVAHALEQGYYEDWVHQQLFKEKIIVTLDVVKAAFSEVEDALATVPSDEELSITKEMAAHRTEASTDEMLGLTNGIVQTLVG